MASVSIYRRGSGGLFGDSTEMGHGILHGDFGHVFVEVHDDHGHAVAADYYPEGKSTTLRTDVDDTRRSEHLHVDLPISESQAESMIQRIGELSHNIPPYEFTGATYEPGDIYPSAGHSSTCVDLSREVLQSGGIWLTDSDWPADLGHSAMTYHAESSHPSDADAGAGSYDASLPGGVPDFHSGLPSPDGGLPHSDLPPHDAGAPDGLPSPDGGLPTATCRHMMLGHLRAAFTRRRTAPQRLAAT